MTFRLSKPLRRTGFSLVELLCVITIMVASAAIAVPRFARSASRYAADAAAKHVAANLFNAQQRARAGSGRCSIQFTEGTGAFRVVHPSVNGSAGRVASHDLGLRPFNSTIHAASFAGSSTVSFDGNGIPSAAGFVSIRSGNELRRISVSASSGAVSIE
jgi:prepilin-type N-terminal cleavage/methylation domain-containing protein